MALRVVSHGGSAGSQFTTALHEAASYDNPEIVRTLLARGAEVEKRNIVSCTLA